MRTWIRTAVAVAAVAVAAVAPASGSAARTAAGSSGPLPHFPPPCAASALTATFTVVPGSNATGHVLYTLTLINNSLSSCSISMPLSLTLLGASGTALPTDATFTPPTIYSVVVPAYQWAQVTAELSPDLAGPGEPTTGACEPSARRLSILIGGASVTAPMDPISVCDSGAMQFGTLRLVPLTTPCTASGLRVGLKRDTPPFDGFALYSLTLHNVRSVPCHADGIVSLRLLGLHGAHLRTRIVAGVSAPYLISAHTTATAIVTVTTSGGHCDAPASNVAVSAGPGDGTKQARIRPRAVRVCRRGLVKLSGLFLNG